MPNSQEVLDLPSKENGTTMPLSMHHPLLEKKVNTCRFTKNAGGAVVVPTILFPTLPEEDVEEMDWEPIVDEMAPPEQLLEHVQQPDEVLLPLDHEDAGPFCYGMMEDEEEEDDGSDYYFSLPSTTGASGSAVDSFPSMGIDISVEVEEEASKATEDLVEETNTMNMEPVAMEDLVVRELTNEEAAIATDDWIVDMVESIAIDISLPLECVPPTTPTTTATVLGSIWVPDPKHGLVRRSARLRARG